jgi:uncharacterized protein
VANVVAIDAPAGWQCDVAGTDAVFEATCQNTGALAGIAQQHFAARIQVPARSDSAQYLTLEATAATPTPEINLVDNTATYRNRIVAVP